MRSQLFKSLIAIAVASTLTACASNRDSMDDTASVDTSMTGSATMDQVGTASTTVDSTGAVASTSTMTDSTTVDSSSQVGGSVSGQTTSSPQSTVSPGTRHQQMSGGSMANTTSRPEPYPKSTVATGNIHDRSAPTPVVSSEQPVASSADTSATQQQYAGSSQAGTATAGQDMSSSTQSTASASHMDSSQTHASTMSGQTSVDTQISPAGAMKTEIVETSQTGASTGGMTASSMDQQAVCGMYARLKSAVSTAEREKIMTEILLNVPRGDSALVDVREQCAS